VTLEEKDNREYHNNEDSHRDKKRGSTATIEVRSGRAFF